MATITDVARDAGVSPTTVSRYLNNRIELPAGTAQRIDNAIERLAYRPNVLARRLSTGRVEAIGLVTPEIRVPFFSELASAVESEADSNGYTVFISSTRHDPKRELAAIRRLQDRHYDGLIMMTTTRDDGTLAAMVEQQRQVVLVDEDIPGVDAPRVFAENERGAYEATRHLIEAGHSDIAFLGGSLDLMTSTERRAGYLRAMSEANIAVRSELMRAGRYAAPFAEEAVTDLMGLAHPPTAIFATGNALVVGAVAALRRAGLSIPGDVSLVGFDDLPATLLVEPALTSVCQPIDELGRMSFRVLLALLRGEPVPAVTRLPVQFMRRGSVAPPREKQRMAPHTATVGAA